MHSSLALKLAMLYLVQVHIESVAIYGVYVAWACMAGGSAIFYVDFLKVDLQWLRDTSFLMNGDLDLHFQDHQIRDLCWSQRHRCCVNSVKIGKKVAEI